jgi:hypothetical protein
VLAAVMAMEVDFIRLKDLQPEQAANIIAVSSK